MRSSQLRDRYKDFYLRREPAVFPNEALIRIFLGSYPNLHLDREFSCHGKRVCDVGFGDGRNFHLLNFLGADLFGTEVHPDIVEHVKLHLAQRGVNAELRDGFNHALPFSDNSMDFLISWNSCYYIGQASSFEEILGEYARLLKPGGVFIFSVPQKSNFIFENAREIAPGYVTIKQDPYDGIRNGEIMRRFACEAELRDCLRGCFHVHALTDSYANYFGEIHAHFFGVAINR